MSNVVKFPTTTRKPVTLEEINILNTQYKLEQVDAVAEDLYEDLFIKMYNYGFDISKEPVAKDVAMVVESIKSLLCKSYGIEHPLHLAVDKLISEKDANDN